jgi:hypothetical protein
MTNEVENLDSGMQRTRRNIMKMGAILVPATFGTIHSTFARPRGGPPGGPPGPPDGPPGPPGGPPGRPGGSCFLRGTNIRTAEGERKIEDLAIGDLLPTMSGAPRPVQWIGRYSFKKSDPYKAWVKEGLPVRIARSALAPNVPHADLCVTALHGVLIDGVLVPAEALLNGSTIARHEPEGDELEFFHVKLASHDVIYAEGAPVETLLHVDESFVNFAEYLRQYGAPADEARCAPYVHVQGGRAELMSRLRSALSPWIDLRDQADVVRDRLEEGAYRLG